MELGLGKKEYIQNFGEKTSWKMSTYRGKRKGLKCILGKQHVRKGGRWSWLSSNGLWF
jgi:hypothetical protein